MGNVWEDFRNRVFLDRPECFLLPTQQVPRRKAGCACTGHDRCDWFSTGSALLSGPGLVRGPISGAVFSCRTRVRRSRRWAFRVAF